VADQVCCALLHPQWQAGAGQVRGILREAAAAVEAARNDGKTQLDSGLLAGLRARYDEQVAWGVTTNRHSDWHKGNHPGYNLAKRLQDKASQVWLFAGNFKIPWTNNASEQALKGPKRHQSCLGILAHPRHACRLLPGAFLPGQRTRPRHPRHRRYPRRPRRPTLATGTRNHLTSRTLRTCQGSGIVA
jgi:hypothetical protein